eukprot:TRINITY_DN4675_c0_g1_i1.p1 TRINITY_DN4675_c0_g1~~TRINITY_DN4675_c0_g1_i1.p1  ORF type:complete len:206 (-),score=35.88 TRINITY_DN4675_c0_g1_i1:49-666(-)
MVACRSTKKKYLYFSTLKLDTKCVHINYSLTYFSRKPSQKSKLEQKKKEYMIMEDIIQHRTLQLEKYWLDWKYNQEFPYIALLRNPESRYEMNTREIVIGRNTGKDIVDINLGNTVNGSRISRIQAIIKLQYNGKFYVRNLGKSRMFVNGIPVLRYTRKQLSHLCLIEFGDVPFIFDVNVKKIEHIREQLANITKKPERCSKNGI